MALSGRDRTRYARHLLLTQLGEAGQERLLSAQVVANGDADAGALAVARRYLTRAGVKVCDGALEDSWPARPSGTDEPTGPQTNEPAGAGASAPAALRVATAEQVASMAGHPGLQHAARALAGALSAVNTLQFLIGAEGATLSGAPVQPQIFFAISSEEA